MIWRALLAFVFFVTLAAVSTQPTDTIGEPSINSPKATLEVLALTATVTARQRDEYRAKWLRCLEQSYKATPTP